MATATTVLTKEGYDRLTAELNLLRTERRAQIADRLHRILEEGGDLIENLAFEEAKNEQAYIEGRIQELVRILANVEFIPPSGGNRDCVVIGSVVTVREDGGRPETFRLVGAVEANPREGRISNQSPLGHALVGCKVGDRVSVNTPDGPRAFTVKAIKQPTE